MPLTPNTWFVVNTHPHKEALAMANLANQGFATYCPVVHKRVTHARRTRDVLRPLFPGYVFVEGAPDKSAWRPLLSTVGVRALLRNGEVPSRLDPRFIEALKAREIEGVVVAPARPYEIGQEIRISAGPFDGTVATIVAMDERDRLVVLMDILNRPVRVRLDPRRVSTV